MFIKQHEVTITISCFWGTMKQCDYNVILRLDRRIQLHITSLFMDPAIKSQDDML